MSDKKYVMYMSCQTKVLDVKEADSYLCFVFY